MDPENRIEITETGEPPDARTLPEAKTQLAAEGKETLERQAGSAPPDETGDWSIPRPEILPRPTYAPAGLAFGAVFLLWGILTSYVVSIVGLIIFIISLAAWIGEILHERGA